MSAGESPARHALVTGATGALGQQVVARFLAAGLHVTTTGRGPWRGESTPDDHVAADLSSMEGVTPLVGRLREPPDIIAALAAAPSAGDVSTMTSRQLRDVMMVKVWAPALLAEHWCPAMAAKGWGRVILTGGVAAHQPVPGFIPGAVANAAVRSLVTALAQQWSRRGVCVTCVTPGAVRSRRFEETRAAAGWVDDRPGVSEAARVLEPGSVADVFAFLASDQAAGVSGGEIVVDGGLLARRQL